MNEKNELNSILLDFIIEQRVFNEEQKVFNEEQKVFNEEQKVFNEEQKVFNEKIDKKIDKVQYFLEETIAEHTKMFFSEQMELKGKVDELNIEVFNLKNDLINLASSFKLMQKNLN